MRRSMMLMAIAGLLLVAAGCAQPVRRYPVNGTKCGNLVFNSQWNYATEASLYRSDWPSTAGYNPTRDVVRFRETIIDRQGQNHYSDDYLYRRFESVRTGRVRR